MKYENRINKIVHAMVACKNRCEGMNTRDGHIPRCLILERKDDKGNYRKGRGCVVVGINPGHAGEKELIEYCKIKERNYDKLINDVNVNLLNKDYYKKLRNLVTELEFSGPILWTELAKCEYKTYKEIKTYLETSRTSLVKNKLQAFRTCTQKYLIKELRAIPINWPLFAIGNESYNVLVYMFANRTVWKIPHPKGSRGHFSKLFDNRRRNGDKKLKLNSRNQLEKEIIYPFRSRIMNH